MIKRKIKLNDLYSTLMTFSNLVAVKFPSDSLGVKLSQEVCDFEDFNKRTLTRKLSIDT